MRGRPARELLRRFTLLTAASAALVVVPAAAAAAGPSPDRAPAVPATLAPDPVPGTSTPPAVTRPVTTAPAVPAVTQPVYVAPVVTPSAPTPVKHAAVVRRVHEHAAPKPKPPVHFTLPRIALPSSLVAVAAAPSHDADVALAGLALLLAAVTAGSGARLVAVWSRRP